MRGIAIFAVMATLTGCGNAEPSKADLQSAMLRYFMGPDSKLIDDSHISLKGERGFRQYVGVEKLGCQPGGDNSGFACDLAIETCIGKYVEGCAPEKANVSGRFVKADAGWQYIPNAQGGAPGRPVDIINEIEMAGIMDRGGMAGCFSTDTPERFQRQAARIGGQPCK